MMLALMLSLLQASPAAPVTVQLNHDQFSSGDRARVYAQVQQDGHLVVLHADASGRVRVLFPWDPTADDFVRGGRRFEVKSRGNRDAFQVDADAGSGTVLAAFSTDPFSYASFTRNDHWDFRALGGPSAAVQGDPLARLLEIVHGMAGDSTRFHYDVATYAVNSRVAYGSDYGSHYSSGFGLRLGFGRPYRYGYGYGSFYDPFCSDPFFWGWGSSCYGFGPRYGWGYGFGYSWYRPFGYRRYAYPYGYRPRPWVFSSFGGTTRTGPRFVIPTGRTRYTPNGVRPRTGASDGFATRGRGGADVRSRESSSPSRGSRPAVSRGQTREPSVRSAPRATGGGRSGSSRPSGTRSGGSRGGRRN
jgi:hypothetical protein